MSKKETWREKVNEFEEKIHVITPEWEEKLGKGKILIPNALDIERLINKTKKGELLTNDKVYNKGIIMIEQAIDIGARQCRQVTLFQTAPMA